LDSASHRKIVLISREGLMPYIRVYNATGADLDAVVVYTPTAPREAVDFGAVANENYSGYREVPIAYRYAEVEASGIGGTYSLRPYDYVGEEPLPDGRYTYRLAAAYGRLTLDLEEDTLPNE
jgi:hypothetical protein